MLKVSEQASEKVDLADHWPGASTFIGTPTRGGWTPILLKIDDFTRPVIHDWICPVCKVLLAGSKTCPKCGLPLLEVPKRTKPLPRRMLLFQYWKWTRELFYTEEEEDQVPIKPCQHNNKPGFKYGDGGKCYTGDQARAKAATQGRAIEASRRK